MNYLKGVPLVCKSFKSKYPKLRIAPMKYELCFDLTKYIGPLNLVPVFIFCLTNPTFLANYSKASGDIYRCNSLKNNSSSSIIDKFISKTPSFPMML